MTNTAVAAIFRRSRNRLTKMKDDPIAVSPANCAALAASRRTPRRSASFCGRIFRRHIKRRVVDEKFAAAVKQAYKLAKSEDAHYLPGWCGPVSG